MNGDSFVATCKLGCWAVGVGAGIVALYLVTSETGFLAALLVAIALAVFLALVLQLLFCWPQEEEEGNDYDPSEVPAPPQGKPLSAPVATVGAVTSSPAAAAPQARMPEPVPEPDPVPEPEPVAEVMVEEPEVEEPAIEEPVVETPSEPEPAPEAETTPDYDGDGVHEGTEEGTRPEGLSAARDGKADNLKEIKGVGPKLEKMLNEMGFFHFDQIAEWSAQEVAWVNANLTGFKGRVTRDNWISQAKILAAGGETEFSKRVDDGDVY